MQAKIIYAVVFLIAFVLTTGAMMYLNNKYENIFKFNFAPSGTSAEAFNQQNKMEPSLSGNDAGEGSSNQDNSNTAGNGTAGEDTTAQAGQKISDVHGSAASADSLNKMKIALEKSKQELAYKEKELQSAKVIEKSRQDSVYVKWKKDMVKTYDKMDPKSVAKILMNMNDNYARDILFSFKDKKRAQIIEILLTLSPDAANRLTRIQ